MNETKYGMLTYRQIREHLYQITETLAPGGLGCLLLLPKTTPKISAVLLNGCFPVVVALCSLPTTQ